MPHAEVILWNFLRNRQIEDTKFRRQFSILNYVSDFYSPELMLAIEVDGSTHITKKELSDDLKHQNNLEDIGIKFLRYTNEEIYGNLEDVLSEIQDKIKKLKSCKLDPR